MPPSTAGGTPAATKHRSVQQLQLKVSCSVPGRSKARRGEGIGNYQRSCANGPSCAQDGHGPGTTRRSPGLNARGNHAPFTQVNRLFAIIYEDDEVLVINKPAGLVCHPTKGDEYSSLISRVRLHLGGGATAHLINRLDRETSGVVWWPKMPRRRVSWGRFWSRGWWKRSIWRLFTGTWRRSRGALTRRWGRMREAGWW